MTQSRLTLFYAWAAWLVQGIGFTAICGLLIVRPGLIAELLPNVPADINLELVELFAPLGFGLGLLTLQVLRPSFGWMRTSLASAFYASWVVALILGWLNDMPWQGRTLCVVMALGNLLFVRRRAPAVTPHSARPDASAEAPMLGRFWGFQMLYYGVCGLVIVIEPVWVAEIMGATTPDSVAEIMGATTPDSVLKGIVSESAQVTALEGNIMRSAAGLYLSMSIISHYAVGAQSDETWRAFCRAFLAAQGVCAATIMVAVSDHRDTGLFVPIFAFVVPNVVMALVNTFSLLDRSWIRRFMNRVRGWTPWWWTLQALVMLAIALVAWIAAQSLGERVMIGVDPGPARLLAIDAVRLTGPLALGAAMLTVLGIMRRDRRGQQQYARLFVVFGMTAIVLRLIHIDSVAIDSFIGSGLRLGVVVIGVMATLVNLLVWMFPDWRTADMRYQGNADTKPRWVYRLFALQFIIYAALAVGTAIWPQEIIGLILMKDIDPSAALVASVRVASPFWALMAAVSAHTAASSSERAWRGLARWFAIWQSAFIVTFVYVFDSNHYNEAVLLLPTLLAVLAALHVRAARSPLNVDDLAGQPEPAGWLIWDASAGVPMVLSTLMRRARPYHRAGVGAVGRFEPLCASRVEVPLPGFFSAERDFLCTVRFSNRTYADDASLDYRGCAVRIEHADGDASLDLVLSTGAFGPVSSAAGLMALRWSPGPLRRRRMRHDHVYREAAIAGLRRAPTSFAELVYHTQLVRWWQGTRGTATCAHRCRLRLVPSCADETGLPDEQDADAPWDTDRRPDDARPPDYLRTELTQRLEAGEVRMRLQVQLSEEHDAEDAMAWYDPSVDWPLPWHDLGVLVLERPLPAAGSETLYFDPGNSAGVLLTPPAPSWRDPRALAASQDRVMRWVGELRKRIHIVLGRRA